MECGVSDSPVDYFCEIAHAEARYLGFINDHEKAWEVDDWKERIDRFCKREDVVATGHDPC